MQVDTISKNYPSYNWVGYAGICPVCGDVIISLCPNDKPGIDHDYATCKCQSIMIDVGYEDSVRYGGNISKLGKVNKRTKYEIITPNETIYCRNFKQLRTLFKRAFANNNNQITNISILVQ